MKLRTFQFLIHCAETFVVFFVMKFNCFSIAQIAQTFLSHYVNDSYFSNSLQLLLAKISMHFSSMKLTVLYADMWQHV